MLIVTFVSDVCPFKCFSKSHILSLGLYLKCMRTWPLLTTPFNIRTPPHLISVLLYPGSTFANPLSIHGNVTYTTGTVYLVVHMTRLVIHVTC